MSTGETGIFYDDGDNEIALTSEGVRIDLPMDTLDGAWKMVKEQVARLVLNRIHDRSDRDTGALPFVRLEYHPPRARQNANGVVISARRIEGNQVAVSVTLAH